MNKDSGEHVREAWTVDVSVDENGAETDENGAETRATAQLCWRGLPVGAPQ